MVCHCVILQRLILTILAYRFYSLGARQTMIALFGEGKQPGWVLFLHMFIVALTMIMLPCVWPVLSRLLGACPPSRYNLSVAHQGPDYWHNILTSVFCLATTGTGWGSRFKVRQQRLLHAL